MKQEIRIGTRESRLAVAQAELLKQHMEGKYPDMQVSLVRIKTTGDKILDKTLAQIGGKGLFVKELELALMESRIDLAVHSLKDLPMEEMPDYPILGYSRREVPNDVLVLPKDCMGLDSHKPIGTSSPRRCIQLRQLCPDSQIASVRGNIVTRLRKLDDGEYGALVLAAAGLIRIGLEHRISQWFTTEQMVPAAGQGILAVQGRKEFDRNLLGSFFDEDAACQAKAERSFVHALDGGCSSPVAAYASVSGAELTLTGFLAEYVTDETVQAGAVRAVITGRKEEAAELGRVLADRVKYILTNSNL